MIKYRSCFLLLTLVTFALLTASPGWGQSIEITRVEQQGTSMKIYYDLLDDNQANRYSLELFSSFDEYKAPLKSVSGDIGAQVVPGKDRRVVWDMAAEYGAAFSQSEVKINFEIRGELFVPFLVMNENYSKLKKGRTYTFTWKVKPGIDHLTAELVRDGEVVYSESSVSVEEYSLTLSSDIRVGQNYQLRISDPANEKNVFTTGKFAVVRRVPLVVYAIPVVAAGIFFATRPEPPQKLPDPITPD